MALTGMNVDKRVYWANEAHSRGVRGLSKGTPPAAYQATYDQAYDMGVYQKNILQRNAI